ncbi:MAG TPA: outer membrane beta-barrel protein [Candidatus Angelobacter sp.]
MTMRTLFTSKTSCMVLALLAAWLTVGRTKVQAQSTAQNQRIADDATAGTASSHKPGAADAGAASAPGVTGKPDVNAEILKELEQMRARIQELEAQLKAQQATSGAVTPADASESSSRPSAEELNVARPSQDPASPVKTQAAAPRAEPAAPFAFADFSWLTGNMRVKEPPVDTKFFTPEVRFDVAYVHSFWNPQDDSLGGSSEIFRSSEFQLTQLGVGGDFHFDNVHGRVMTQLGMYSQTQPRNDASVARGQWTLDNAYRYLSEAYGGYHFNVAHGLNVDAGIFLSYIGLFSFYNFDNWAYQPSYVSSNTPWFFNGLRIQYFPTDKLKIEPWFINGWQSYGRFNNRPGIGGEILWRPNGSVSITLNQYILGADTLNTPGRIRYHTDDSIQVKYYDHPERTLTKMAFTFTGDMGCEHGGGVSCAGDSKKGPKQSFIGYMVYNRFWFHKDLYAFTLGGGQINNPGRYLVLLPPINGATAITGTPYFTENPGDPFKAWDTSATIDWMPKQYITFRWEYNYRDANVPYFSGPGGITPAGGNTGNPSVIVPGFTPDLRKFEQRVTGAILVAF